MSENTDFRPRRHGRSLFGPVLLIALGILFLLANLGIISGLNWVGVLQLWPLVLVFIGVNILARQMRGGFGTLLSGLVALTAVAVFGYILLAGEDNALLNRLGVSQNIEIKREDLEFTAEDIQQAKIDVELDAVDGHFFALANSPNLIEGSVSYTGDLIFETDTSGDNANITLDTRDDRFPFWGIGSPNFSQRDSWQIGLNPDVMTDLNINAGSGSLNLDLAALTLSDLTVDTGSGSSELFLPGGEFEIGMHSGSGSTEISLAGDGRYELKFDAGSGDLTVYLPPTTAARIDFNGGSGSLHIDDTFRHVSGNEQNGVWETAGFDTADSYADMTLQVGSGSVWIKPLGGR